LKILFIHKTLITLVIGPDLEKQFLIFNNEIKKPLGKESTSHWILPEGKC